MSGADALQATITKAWALDPAEQQAILASKPQLRQAYLIHAVLANLFDHPADEAHWMRSKIPSLNDQAPIDVIQAYPAGLALVLAVVNQMAAW